MNNWRKNTSLFLAVVFFIMLGIVQPVGAASSTKTVQAYQGVTIIYNGQQLTDTTPSYIIDGTTYIPLRMLMSNFGKGVEWNGTNKQVIISDATSGSITGSASQQIVALQNQIDQLQQTIATLDSRVSTLKGDSSDDASLSDIKSDLNDYFEDAGDDYFDDDGIDTTISLSGDEDDLVYTITLDFYYADDYDDLKDIGETDLKTLMSAVKSKIASLADDTDYEDADITGKLVDEDESGYYVKYNGSSYTYSWDDDISLSDIRSTLNDYFEDAGDDYFGDDGITASISLSGDEDDLAYTIKLDFSYADYYSDLTEVSTTDLKDLILAVKSRINSEIDDTYYEDADITGRIYDNDDSDYYVIYDGSSYTFSWN